MCGIVGIYKSSGESPLNDVINGLKRLEYRGYDSAGVAVVGDRGFACQKAIGKICTLEEKIKSNTISGNICIGHTRWATHGSASIKNTHPIETKHVAIVHNGIIENYAEIAKEENFVLDGDTDTEVICHLLDKEYEETKDIKRAVFNVVARIRGAFALSVVFKDFPDLLIGIKYNSPLVCGIFTDGYCISSDTMAMPNSCQKVIYMDDGDVVFIQESRTSFYNNGEPIQKTGQAYTPHQFLYDKGEFKHFMLKEMFEQPTVISNLLSTYLEGGIPGDVQLSAYKSILILACGSSLYAGMVAKYWFERYLKIHTDVEIASEFTYRDPVVLDGTLVIVISQSGETADTINAMSHVKKSGAKILAIVNVKGSTIDRGSDWSLLTLAGPEIGVASTKAFTAQLTLLAILVIHSLGKGDGKVLSCELLKLPHFISEVFKLKDEIALIANNEFTHFKNALFLARDSLYPIALEGALKLKEISYIHAEGYTSGELKHGPIALIDEEMPVIILANSRDSTFTKLKSNIENVLSRKGRIFLFTDQKDHTYNKSVQTFCLPGVDTFIAPILYTIPVQLLAYYTALGKGTDVDQPRNLAKSVTVE